MTARRSIFMTMLALSLVAQQEEDLRSKSKIAFTPHNFVGSSVLAGSDSTVQDFTLCRQCHTPSKMRAVEALWDRSLNIKAFDIEYPNQNDADGNHFMDINNRRCLFCHDGSMATGFSPAQLSVRHQNQLDNQVALDKNYSLHLFEFPTNSSETIAPRSGDSLSTAQPEQVTCISCHDPHNNEKGNFLRHSTEGSELCLSCHKMANWDFASHGNPVDPRFAPLKNQACASCHDVHAVPPTANLLLENENTLCLSCHDGLQDTNLEIASETDLEAVFEKAFVHPIWWEENPGNPDDRFDTWSAGMLDSRSVKCSDCHNPHAAADHSQNPFIDGSQVYVKGVDSHGFPKSVADYEYETCYKCHGMNQNAGPGKAVGWLFARTNKSFHPIEAPGNNPFVPSLKADWSEQSMLRCSDCHGNDDPLEAQGPHGSNIPHILKATYADFPFASPDENQLCFLCHEEQRVVQSNGFKFHQLHIQDAGYACSACHDPHGSIE
ncbi:MAG: hypothetical protein L3J79_09745 [Candidatus Marinimicrobia bacterium]|nr:hypothetical protein [Candidatus Neomarinimicrobiota bacterium]